jgi:hypothetical protein
MPSAPKRALDQPGQLIRSAVDGLIQGRSPVSDRDGLAAFHAGFHHAPLVALAVLIAVLVVQVDLHSRNVIANPAQRTLDYLTDLSSQRLVTFNVMVGIDLYLHGVLLFSCLLIPRSLLCRGLRELRDPYCPARILIDDSVVFATARSPDAPRSMRQSLLCR